MWKKIALGGAVAAAIVGVGTAAVATSGSSSSAADGQGHPAAVRAARHMVHGQFVTRGEDSKFVTHDVIRGQVTDVSATSISVKAADGVSETFAVTGDTKVRIRSNGVGKPGTIGDVHVGNKALVIGTGSDKFTATRILAGG